MESARNAFSCCFGGTLNSGRSSSSKKDEIVMIERRLSSLSQNLQNGKKSTKPIDFLTPKERSIIVNSWKNVPDKVELGERIYCHIFMQKPALLSLYPFADASVLQMREHPAFKRQAMVFSQFLQLCVNHLSNNDGDALNALCSWAGERHARITRIRFQPEWWELFVTALIDCLQPYCRSSPAVLQAWKVLMAQVLLIMQEAFDQATKELSEVSSHCSHTAGTLLVDSNAAEHRRRTTDCCLKPANFDIDMAINGTVEKRNSQ